MSPWPFVQTEAKKPLHNQEQLQITFVKSALGPAPAGPVSSALFVGPLFQPLRRRIKSFIDRRFYRRKYDAAQALKSFAKSTRDEVDLDALSRDLLLIVQETMEPERLGLWLKPDAKR